MKSIFREPQRKFRVLTLTREVRSSNPLTPEELESEKQTMLRRRTQAGVRNGEIVQSTADITQEVITRFTETVVIQTAAAKLVPCKPVKGFKKDKPIKG